MAALTGAVSGVNTVTWNAETWNSADEGPVRVAYSHSAPPIEIRTGADEYPQTVLTPSKSLEVSVTVAKFCDDHSVTCGTTSNLVATMRTCGGTAACTFPNMALVNVSATGDRDAPSEKTLSFVHVSSDGTTSPL